MDGMQLIKDWKETLRMGLDETDPHTVNPSAITSRPVSVFEETVRGIFSHLLLSWSSPVPQYQGFLFKKGWNRTNWTKRFFVLRRNVLFYYKNSSNFMEQTGCIPLDRWVKMFLSSFTKSHWWMQQMSCGRSSIFGWKSTQRVRCGSRTEKNVSVGSRYWTEHAQSLLLLLHFLFWQRCKVDCCNRCCNRQSTKAWNERRCNKEETDQKDEQEGQQEGTQAEQLHFHIGTCSDERSSAHSSLRWTSSVFHTFMTPSDAVDWRNRWFVLKNNVLYKSTAESVCNLNLLQTRMTICSTGIWTRLCNRVGQLCLQFTR